MAQEYTVTKAFQATVSKEDKTPKSFESHGQTLFVWKIQVAGNPNWLNINKQAGNEVKAGDVIYGSIVPNQWNTGFDFKAESRPLGEAPAAQQPAQSSSQAPAANGSLEAKVDYLVKGMETLLGIRDDALAAFGGQNTTTTTQDTTQNSNLDDLDI